MKNNLPLKSRWKKWRKLNGNNKKPGNYNVPKTKEENLKKTEKSIVLKHYRDINRYNDPKKQPLKSRN